MSSTMVFLFNNTPSVVLVYILFTFCPLYHSIKENKVNACSAMKMNVDENYLFWYSFFLDQYGDKKQI